jgi:uncharacterized membrane protein
MNETTEIADPHEAIARLEARMEELSAQIENCRKFIIASRAAIALGGLVLVAGMIGVIRFDAAIMGGAIAAVLGGIVLLGSNSSTAREAGNELAAIEAQRAKMIGMMHLRVVGGRETIH